MNGEIPPTNRIEEKRLQQYRDSAVTANKLMEEHDNLLKRMETFKKTMGGNPGEHPAQFCQNFLATWAKSQLQ